MNVRGERWETRELPSHIRDAIGDDDDSLFQLPAAQTVYFDKCKYSRPEESQWLEPERKTSATATVR